jgi:hypothetical protein
MRLILPDPPAIGNGSILASEEARAAMWTCEMQTRSDRCGKSKLTIARCQPNRRLGSISKGDARIMLSMRSVSSTTPARCAALACRRQRRCGWCALAAQCLTTHLSESNCSLALRSWGVKLHQGTEVATWSSAETRSDLLNATRPRPPADQKRRRTDGLRLRLSFFLTTRPLRP